jgi:hypothetical protein
MLVLTIQNGWETYFFKVIRNPQRDRGAPITVTGNRPVACIGEPVSESILTNIWRYPAKRGKGAENSGLLRHRWNKNSYGPSSLAVVFHKVIDDM